jgi:hypothetical protein
MIRLMRLLLALLNNVLALYDAGNVGPTFSGLCFSGLRQDAASA